MRRSTTPLVKQRFAELGAVPITGNASRFPDNGKNKTGGPLFKMAASGTPLYLDLC